MPRPIVLRLDGVTKRFGPQVANDSIGFALAEGEVIALLGENGAGKTTLMNILFGHYVADAGTVEVMGRPLPPGQPRAALAAGVGMVHQHFTLADNLTVLENITLGTRPLWRLGKGNARARIADLSRRFGLEVAPDARVADLAVGQAQRVEILKALYRDARILILDEPTAVLTPQETAALFRTLRLAIAQGLSIVFISHKLHEVMAISDRVLVLRHGRLVGERRTAETDRHELARLMVGAEIAPPAIPAVAAGPVLLALSAVSDRRQPGPARRDPRAPRRPHHRHRRRLRQRPGRARRPRRRHPRPDGRRPHRLRRARRRRLVAPGRARRAASPASPRTATAPARSAR